MTMQAQTFAMISEAQMKYNAAIAAVRKDARLSDEGKREQIVQHYTDTKAEVERLKAEDAAQLDQRRSDLRRTLFGPSSYPTAAETMAVRDAQDRVAKATTPDALAKLMANAAAADDKSMLRACLASAFERAGDAVGGDKWERVLVAYAEQYPHEADRLSELAALSVPNSTTREFEVHIATSVPPPRELTSTPKPGAYAEH